MQETIDLKSVYFLLRKRLKWIISSTLLGFLIMFLISWFVLPEKYTATIEMYVNNNKTTTTGDININDITASQKLVNSYMVILQHDNVLEQVQAKIAESVSLGELRKAISLKAVNGTEVLRISVETENSDLSAKVCNALGEIAPVELPRVVEGGRLAVIGQAKAPTNPSSPNIKVNSALGALVGMAIAIAISLIIFVFDNTVKSEEDFKRQLEIPVLGEIPSFESLSRGGKTNAH